MTTIEFKDGRGRTCYRMLTRRNVRKVAASIQRAHPGHPLSHTIAILEKIAAGSRVKARLECSCEAS